MISEEEEEEEEDLFIEVLICEYAAVLSHGSYFEFLQNKSDKIVETRSFINYYWMSMDSQKHCLGTIFQSTIRGVGKNKNFCTTWICIIALVNKKKQRARSGGEDLRPDTAGDGS